jgi:hypothetical protein
MAPGAATIRVPSRASCCHSIRPQAHKVYQSLTVFSAICNCRLQTLVLLKLERLYDSDKAAGADCEWDTDYRRTW